MPSTIRCLSCGATFTDAVGPCVYCGGVVELSVTLTGVEAKAIAGRVGAVADETTEAGGQEIRYAAPSGAHSKSVLVEGQVHAQIEPPVDVGRRGESRVFQCVLAQLVAVGLAPVSLPASDQAGEDRVIQVGGERVTLQIVTASPDMSFWGGVARGSQALRAEIGVAAGWINKAILEKSDKYPESVKSSMLLAVDVAHFGVLSSPRLLSTYLGIYGDPSLKFQFGGVWLVGPTERHCTRLGKSRW